MGLGRVLSEVVVTDIRAFLTGCHVSVYAGIGSRETPRDVLDLMTRIAERLDVEGWTLRSGGADGADTAFEKGAVNQEPEIFLPWARFNGRKHGIAGPTHNAIEIASKHHPNWRNLSRSSQSLISRNTHQILGRFCDSPSAFVLCWTPDGATEKTTAKTGGTGQAIRVAVAYKVPVYNLNRDDQRKTWEAWLS